MKKDVINHHDGELIDTEKDRKILSVLSDRADEETIEWYREEYNDPNSYVTKFFASIDNPRLFINQVLTNAKNKR